MQVGSSATLSLPSKSRVDREHRLQVVVRAEGPTRVLSVVDTKVLALNVGRWFTREAFSCEFIDKAATRPRRTVEVFANS